MQTRYQLRHSPSCTLEKSPMKEARPAPQSHSLAPASIWLGYDFGRPYEALDEDLVA